MEIHSTRFGYKKIIFCLVTRRGYAALSCELTDAHGNRAKTERTGFGEVRGGKGAWTPGGRGRCSGAFALKIFCCTCISWRVRSRWHDVIYFVNHNYIIDINNLCFWMQICGWRFGVQIVLRFLCSRTVLLVLIL